MSTTDVHVALNRGNSVVERHAGLPPRRPTSARGSFVQHKLQSALSQAATERQLDLATVESQASFQCSKRFSLDEPQCDRSVYRYRSEAATVSCTDPTNVFTYAANFLPGAHFYTFLASKDSVAVVPGGAGARRKSQLASIEDTGNGAVGSTGGAAVETQRAAAPTDALDRLNDSAKPSAGFVATKKRTALRMWIPDTVVYGETGRAVWLSSDKDGFVQRYNDFNERHVLEKLGSAAACNDTLERTIVVYKEPVVSICKRGRSSSSSVKHAASSASSDNSQMFTSSGNTLRLLSPGELKTLLSHVASSKKCFVVQQFVKCNGAKACVVRAVHEAKKPAFAWMISNVVPCQDVSAAVVGASSDASSINSSADSTSAVLPQTTPLHTARGGSQQSELGTAREAATATPAAPSSSTATPLASRLCTSVQVDKACTFVKLNERGCAAVSELNQRLVKHIEHKLHVQLQSLVADYIKDTSGRWWLLQVKAFRVKSRMPTNNDVERVYSLPAKLRGQYLSYRDSSIVDNNSDGSDNDDNDDGSNNSSGRRSSNSQSNSVGASRSQSMAALTQRQVHKLAQCKCCLASYPKTELAFKMTLKMISEMLVRIRTRLPPDKTYGFLTAALNNAATHDDASLAYESSSVCSFCYAIYERDQQLKRVESKFSAMLGLPSAATAADGLSRIDDPTPAALAIEAANSSSSSTALPPQLTLCRLLLVFNAIYDIPKDLYDAEQLHFSTASLPLGARKTKALRSIASKLYLRISALGYTECIPLCADDMEVASNKAPRGASLRRCSSAASDLDDDEPVEGAANDTKPPANYWLPINIIRTLHFAAPRTPLGAKLRDTSGIAALLNDNTSNIVVQFIRATEPPLKDPATVTRRLKKRRAALVPAAASVSDMVTAMQQPHHSVLLGSTTIRLAQFRSAYVTKIDFYACMALSGELFNLKGNIGLERLRYVDTKLLLAQHRLRTFHGVVLPDDAYRTNDPLSPEWMDALLVSFHKQARLHSERKRGASRSGAADYSVDEGERTSSLQRQASSAMSRRRQKGQPTGGEGHADSQQLAQSTRHATSLFDDDDDNEMDEELEAMIDLVDRDEPITAATWMRSKRLSDTLALTTSIDNESSITTSPDIASIAVRKHKLLQPTTTATSASMRTSTDRHAALLLHRTALSPRSALGDLALRPSSTLNKPSDASIAALVSPRTTRRLWCLVVQLHDAHHLQSHTHAFCRWACHYTLLQQKRSAVERRNASTDDTTHVEFACTHKFFVAGTAAMVTTFLETQAHVALHLRNDMYASTRATTTQSEFVCTMRLLPLLTAASTDQTLDIRREDDASEATSRDDREGDAARPFLSVSIHLMQLALEPDDATASGAFVELSTTREGLHVLRKI